MSHEVCEDCLKDPKIHCPRNADAQCLECGAKLCGYHIGIHLHDKHCISLTWRGIGAE